jgi:hypothetical protein
MRTTAFVLFFALVIIACGQAPTPQAPEVPREAEIVLDVELHERLELGLPLALELRAGDEQVGTCTLFFDLWDERYETSRSRTELGFAASAPAALRHCIEKPVTTTVRVQELPHRYQPGTDYPVH